MNTLAITDDNQDIWLSINDAAASLGCSEEWVLEAVDHEIVTSRRNAENSLEVRRFDLSQLLPS